MEEKERRKKRKVRYSEVILCVVMHGSTDLWE